MTKKHFIDLADHMKAVIMTAHRDATGVSLVYTDTVISELANFCRRQNPNFNCGRWVSYIRGECGPSGGKIKKAR